MIFGVPAIFFFANTFWIIYFNSFHAKYALKTRRIIAIKNDSLIISKNAGTVLCSSLLEMYLQSLELNV